MITEYRLMPWTHSRRYNDGISDAFIKLKAKVKALAEDFKRLSTAKKVAIILGSIASIIGGIVAAVKVGNRKDTQRLSREAQQRFNIAQEQVQSSRENINRVISSNSSYRMPIVGVALEIRRSGGDYKRFIQELARALNVRHVETRYY